MKKTTSTQSIQRSDSDIPCVRVITVRPARGALQKVYAVPEVDVDSVFLQVIQNMYRDLHHMPGLREVQVRVSRYTPERHLIIFEEWQTPIRLQQALLRREWRVAFDEIQPILSRNASVLGPYMVTEVQEQAPQVDAGFALPPNFADMLLPAPFVEHLSEEEIEVVQQATGAMRRAIVKALFAEQMAETMLSTLHRDRLPQGRTPLQEHVLPAYFTSFLSPEQLLDIEQLSEEERRERFSWMYSGIDGGLYYPSQAQPKEEQRGQ